MSLFKEDKEAEVPVIFKENNSWKDNPLIFMDKDINGVTSFAILQTTDGGKWVRGNKLFYQMNGVSIYTDIDNIIFVNTETKTMFVREYKKVIKEISPKDPENKQYILLYTDLSYGEEAPLRWEACQGRTSAYNNIISNASVIDIDKSIVIVESVAIEDALSIREFVNYLKNADYVSKDDGFDINDYSGSGYI